MTDNLLRNSWIHLDAADLRLFLNERVRGLGQYDDRSRNPNKLHLPLAGLSCRISLIFRGNRIVAIEPGQAFDRAEWERISQEIETSILAGPMRVGREYSFNSFRVSGFWRGQHSGVQILPPPDDAPRASVEIAEHPFILEFPIIESGFWPVTNHRRMREHRKLTLLLNILLAGRTSLPPRRSENFWVLMPGEEHRRESAWLQQFFSGKLGKPVIDALSPAAGEKLEELDPEEYYSMIGHDGKGLRVPADLDHMICLCRQLSPSNRAKFERASYWVDMASRLWAISLSSSFASLVSAVESLTDRGIVHRVYCEKCKDYRQHDVPGATERFQTFFERYAPGGALKKRRGQMYSLRSGILHGSELMKLDQDRAFGWDPPWWNEHELHEELWVLTRVALRNWLKNPKT